MIHKNKNENLLPSQDEMSEIKNLFNSNELNLLEKKTKELIKKYPNVSIFYNILGFISQNKNNYDEAILNFNKAIDINPYFDQAHNNLGNVLYTKGKYEKAIESYKKTIEINPKYAEAYSNLGNALAKSGKFEEAISNQKYALKLKPDIPEFYDNLGSSLTELGKFEEAIVNHEKAIKLKPNFAEAYGNLANAQAGMEKYREAITNYQLSLKLNPKYKIAILNESFVRLTLGEFEVGWEKYEARLGVETKTPLKYEEKKMWDGNYLDGTLLVWGEQGLGEHVIYGSMLADLKNYSKKILLQVDKRLENLYRRYFEKDSILNIKLIDSEKNYENNFDKHIAIGSLGKFLRKSKESFKTTPKKYLVPSPLKEKEYKRKFFNNNKLKIGISWKTLNKVQQYRNIDLKEMLPILSISNCEFINLQFGKFDNELDVIKSKFDINIKSISEIDNFNNIDELAALINCLDLVITIQNTTAHISGALGKKTWLMLVNNARWHWLKNENKSIWYPSTILYRQKKNGNWNDVVNNISKDLKSLI